MALDTFPTTTTTATALSGRPSNDALHDVILDADQEALAAIEGLDALADIHLTNARAGRILLEVEGKELLQNEQERVTRRISKSERLAALALIQREAVQGKLSVRHPEGGMN